MPRKVRGDRAATEVKDQGGGGVVDPQAVEAIPTEVIEQYAIEVLGEVIEAKGAKEAKPERPDVVIVHAGALGIYDPDQPMTFGQRLRKWRKARHWTQDELAQRCGIDQGFISQIETGRIQKPSIEYLRLLAKGYGVPITEMLVAAGYLSHDDLDGEALPYLDRYVESLRGDAEILAQLRELDSYQWAESTFADLVEALRLHLSMILRGHESGGEGEGQP